MGGREGRWWLYLFTMSVQYMQRIHWWASQLGYTALSGAAVLTVYCATVTQLCRLYIGREQQRLHHEPLAYTPSASRNSSASWVGHISKSWYRPLFCWSSEFAQLCSGALSLPPASQEHRRQTSPHDTSLSRLPRPWRLSTCSMALAHSYQLHNKKLSENKSYQISPVE